MRSLSLTLGFLSLLLVSLTPKSEAVPAVAISSVTWQDAARNTPYEDVRLLLHTIERARVMEAVETCSELSPIPLYEHSPSLEDWTRYCTAVVSGDQEACDDIADTIEPDLHSFCLQ